MSTEYKLSDEAIAHIAQLVQMGILTGTDIIDNFRMITLTANDENNLELEKNYAENFKSNLNTMVENIEELAVEDFHSKNINIETI
tara:strand:+ start:1241 stop:1498 length:258 start_codon:yes stop_codon:yes gene_type:complete